MNPTSNKVKTNLALAPDIWLKIKEAADNNRRSITREIEYRLERDMDREGK